MRSISVRLIRDGADVGALNTFPQGNADAFVSGRYDALLSHANAIAAQWSAYYADRTEASYRVIVVDTGATPTSPRGVKHTSAARLRAAVQAKKIAGIFGPPVGVALVGIDPIALHNAIADAVGEANARIADRPARWDDYRTGKL